MSAESNAHLRLVYSAEESGPVQIPPHDLDAEGAVLSALLIDDSCLHRIDSWLLPTHFYAEAHRWIYEAILAVSAKNATDERACMVRVATWLKDHDRLVQAGGMPYLTETLGLCIVAATPHNISKYAETVYEKWRARQIIEKCRYFVAQGYVDYGDTQDYADRAAKELADIARASIAGDIEGNLAALKRIVGRLRDAQLPENATKLKSGIPTGLHGYDYETGGLHSGHKTTIAALPGVGKTALALQIADHVASQNIGVLVMSNEMSRDECLERILARRARVDGRRIKAGTLTQREWDLITVAVAEIPRLPLVIDDTDGMTIGHVVTRMRREVERFCQTHGVPLGLVVLDWIQNLTREPQDRGLKENEFIKRCTKAFKDTLKELKIPGIETAQQKPSEIDRVTKLRPKPAKGSVADSSWIEKVAENVAYLHRNPMRNVHDKIVGEDPSSLTLIMTKNRGGEEGELQIRFAGATQQFECIDPSFHS
jgi:replicative DNA helicase